MPQEKDEEKQVVVETQHDAELRATSGEAVQEDEDKHIIPRGAPRDEMAKEIARKQRERNARDREEKPEEEQAEKEQPEEKAAKPDEEQQEEASSETLTVKADGEEYEVTAEQIKQATGLDPDGGGIRVYQTILAAEHRLKEANNRLKRAKALQAETERVKPEEQRETQSESVGDDGLTEEQRATVDRLRDEWGDELAETKRDLYALQNRVGQTTAQPNELVEQTTNHVVQVLNQREQERALQDANAWFSEKYSHVESDPVLGAGARQIGQELMAENQARLERGETPRSPMELVQEIGKRMDRWTESNRGTGAFDQKLERKRTTATSTPRASARMERTPEPSPKSASDKIREMRQARGLPV